MSSTLDRTRQGRIRRTRPKVSRADVADAWHRSPDGHDVAPGGHEAAGEVVPQLAELEVTPTSVRVVGDWACCYSSGRGRRQSPASNLPFAAANSSSERMPSLCRSASSRSRSERVGSAAAELTTAG